MPTNNFYNFIIHNTLIINKLLFFAILNASFNLTIPVSQTANRVTRMGIPLSEMAVSVLEIAVLVLETAILVLKTPVLVLKTPVPVSQAAKRGARRGVCFF